MAQCRSDSFPYLIRVFPSSLGRNAHRSESKPGQCSTGYFQILTGDLFSIRSGAIQYKSRTRITLLPKEKKCTAGQVIQEVIIGIGNSRPYPGRYRYCCCKRKEASTR